MCPPWLGYCVRLPGLSGLPAGLGCGVYHPPINGGKWRFQIGNQSAEKIRKHSMCFREIWVYQENIGNLKPSRFGVGRGAPHQWGNKKKEGQNWKEAGTDRKISTPRGRSLKVFDAEFVRRRRSQVKGERNSLYLQWIKTFCVFVDFFTMKISDKLTLKSFSWNSLIRSISSGSIPAKNYRPKIKFEGVNVEAS